MIERLIQACRGWGADRAKARAYLAHQAETEFRELMADYDGFVPVMAQAPEPALPLGTARDSLGTPVEVRLPLEDLAAHCLVSGATGSGKTTFVTGLLAEALRQGHPVGTLDCKAGFFEASLAWAGAIAYRLPPEQRRVFVRRLVVVNPFSEHLVPLNVCRVAPGASAETQAYDVARILSYLFGDLGFQTENLLLHLVLLLQEAELSLVEAPEVLQDELLRGILVERAQNPAVRAYFGQTFPEVPSSAKAALVTRLQSLSVAEPVRLMLGADDLLDFKGILDRGDPLFLFCGMGQGIPAELVELVGTLLLQQLFVGAFAAGRERRPYWLCADEFFHLVDVPVLAKRFERGLASLRAFGVHLALVMHQFSQVPGGLREAILANCDLMALFRTSSRNASYFGDFLPEQDPEVIREALRRTGRVPGRHEVRMQLVERLQRLPDRTMYWYDRRKPYRAVLVRVPDLPAPHEAAGIARESLEAFIEAEGIRAGGAALPRQVLREQLEARQERLRQLVRPPIYLVRPPEAPAPAAEAGQGQPAPKRRPRLG